MAEYKDLLTLWKDADPEASQADPFSLMTRQPSRFFKRVIRSPGGTSVRQFVRKEHPQLPPVSIYKQMAYLFTSALPAIEPACIAG